MPIVSDPVMTYAANDSRGAEHSREDTIAGLVHCHRQDNNVPYLRKPIPLQSISISLSLSVIFSLHDSFRFRVTVGDIGCKDPAHASAVTEAETA